MKIPKKYLRLLVTAENFPDESLRGYLLRLCGLNGYPRPEWLAKLAGYGQYRTPPNDQSFQLLSQLSGTQDEQLHPFAYNGVKRVEGGRHPVQYCYFGKTLIKRCWLIQRLTKICPHCLTESPYLRAVWDIKFVTACAKHNVALLEQCPSCHQRLNLSRGSVAFCKCGFDLRTAITNPLNGPELELNKLIYSSNGLHPQIVASDHGLPIGALASLEFSELLNIIIFAGRASQLATERRDLSRGGISSTDAAKCMKGAAECFSSWPKNFHAFLRTAVGNRKNTGFFNISRELKSLYRQSYFLVKSPKFEFLQRAIAEYLRQNWDGGPRRGSAIATLPQLQRNGTRYITCREATSLLHSNSTTVLRLLRNGVLKGKTAGEGRKRAILIARRSLDRLRQHLSCCVNTNEAARMLGVTERTVMQFKSAGLLKAQKNPVRRYVRLFRKQDVDALLSAADKASKHNQTTRTITSLRGALFRTGIPIANFMRHIQLGMVHPVTIDVNRIGLHKYAFDVNELQALKGKFN